MEEHELKIRSCVFQYKTLLKTHCQFHIKLRNDSDRKAKEQEAVGNLKGPPLHQEGEREPEREGRREPGREGGRKGRRNGGRKGGNSFAELRCSPSLATQQKPDAHHVHRIRIFRQHHIHSFFLYCSIYSVLSRTEF